MRTLVVAFLLVLVAQAEDIGPIKPKGGVGFKVGDTGKLSDVDYRVVDASFGNAVIVAPTSAPTFRFFLTLGNHKLANGSVGKIRGEWKIEGTINYRGRTLHNAKAVKGGTFEVE